MLSLEPFISNKADGSGLGLALVASVIADHEGMISVQSQSGFTQFEIHYPLRRSGPTHDDFSAASKLTAQLPLIIVADDDKSVRLVIAQALTRQGYQVQTTATAAGMWDLSLASRGALLITDVGFPDGDALDMLPRLRARKPDLTVIVMSARQSAHGYSIATNRCL